MTVIEHDEKCESYAEQGPRRPVLPCGCAARAEAPTSAVVSVWYQPPSEGVMECIAVEVLGGPKRFRRIWIDDGHHSFTRPDWGWRVHETATQIWPT